MMQSPTNPYGWSAAVRNGMERAMHASLAAGQLPDFTVRRAVTAMLDDAGSKAARVFVALGVDAVRIE